jgi:predicted  nucleic acid-binding Zn-ribbon protein
MEALKMEPQANSWSDDRLDDLSRQTEKGFEEVKGEFKAVRQEIKELSDRTDEGFKELSLSTDKRFDEVKGEFKAVRQEIKELSDRTDEIKGEMKDGFAQMPSREEMNQRFAELNRSNNTLLIVGGTLFAAIIGTGILG